MMVIITPVSFQKKKGVNRDPVTGVAILPKTFRPGKRILVFAQVY